MIKTLLRIRVQQGIRSLKEIGLFRILFFTPLAGLILFVALNFIRQGMHMNLLGGLLCASLLSSHLRRNDKRFMKTLQWPAGWVFSLEYILLFIPFIIGYAFSPQPLYAVGLVAVLVGIAWIPFTWTKKQRNLIRKIPLIPAAAFEWKSGIRQSGWVVAFIYIVCLGFSWEPAVSPIFLLVFSLISTTFHLHGEPAEMIEGLGLTGRQFIWRKVRSQLLIFWTICLPFVVLMCVQLYATWPVILYTLVVCSSIQTIAVLYKYALYQPNADLRRNIMFIGLATISFFVPPMVPVPIFLIIRNWPKSVHNVNRYLYA